MGISVIRTYNERLIYECVNDCFFDIVEDETSLNALNKFVDCVSDCWVEINNDGVLIGVVQFTPYNKSTLEAHPYVLRSQRKFSEKAMKAAIAYFDTEIPATYKSLTTNVPTCKRYAARLAYKVGFKRVGVLKQAFFKDGAYHDMLLFQLMR